MIVLFNGSGGLCNRIILFAHAYGTSIKYNKKIVHLFWSDLKNVFKTNVDSNVLLYPRKLDWMYRFYRKITNHLKLNPDRKRNSTIKAKGIQIIDDWYYRDYSSLFTFREKICQLFQPVDAYRDMVDYFWDSFKLSNVKTTIGLHMRLGDYSQWRNGKYYYEIDAYREWMQQVANEFNFMVQFIICTNVDLNIDSLRSDKYNVYLGPGDEVIDLYILSKCDYIMGPPSTYSWWAAFYGNKPYLTLLSQDQIIKADSFSYVVGEEFNPA